MRFRRALLALFLLCLAADALAQPIILAPVRPTPNAEGWNNSEVAVIFACGRAVQCPELVAVDTEGRGQVATGTAIDADRVEASATATFNIDRTPPVVEIMSPADNGTTTASSVRVVARASDALSGLASAACNGRAATVDEGGTLQCVVPLRPGVNDVVIEAMDRADNSGSAGFRITRTGSTSYLRIVPDALGLLVGRPQQLQVIDDFGRVVSDVVWRVSNPLLAEMSDDGKNTVTPKATGVVTVTAIRGGLAAEAAITIYRGAYLPRGATRWRVGSIKIEETPESERPHPGVREQQLLLLEDAPSRFGLMTSIGAVSGLLDWTETAPIDESETVVARQSHAIGGGLYVVESRDGSRSSLVRAGRSANGTPWRFRADGHLSRELAQDGRGAIAIVETGPDRFPRLLLLNGVTGRLIRRWPVLRGSALALNLACVEDANARRDVPATVGPPTLQPNGALMFELLRVDDLEDFLLCGSVSGRLRRVLEMVSFGPDGADIQLLRFYEVPVGSPAPVVSLFPVVSDGHGGQLAPWVARFGEHGLVESRVMHITAEGKQEYTLPAVGEIFLGEKDLAATTDGTTLVAFNVLTGEVRWTRLFPAKGVRILSTKNGLIIAHGETSEVFDQYGRAIPLQPIAPRR